MLAGTVWNGPNRKRHAFDCALLEERFLYTVQHILKNGLFYILYIGIYNKQGTAAMNVQR